MNKILVSVCIAIAAASYVEISEAKGGFSGGGRGGFSSPSRPSYTPSRPSVAPTTPTKPAVAPQQPSKPVVAPPTPPSNQYRYTAPSSSYSNRVGQSTNYGLMGMGASYAGGVLTGVIIGNMLHPQNSQVYNGGGQHSNNTLLYPDGRVVTPAGVHVGNYVNGTFTPVANGEVVAKPVPSDAYTSLPSKSDSSSDNLFSLFLILLVFVLIVSFVSFIAKRIYK